MSCGEGRDSLWQKIPAWVPATAMLQHLGPLSSWVEGTWSWAPRAILKWLCPLTQVDTELCRQELEVTTGLVLYPQ